MSEAKHVTEDGQRELVLVSFGYENGAAQDCFRTFNAKALCNPSRELRKKHSGTSLTLQADFFKAPGVQDFFDATLQEICGAALSESRGFEQELRIGIGCERGRHRSVALVERLARELHLQAAIAKQYTLRVEHRDLGSDTGTARGKCRDKTQQRQRARDSKYTNGGD